MAVFVKIFFVLLAVALIGGFLVNHLPTLKERLIEIVNPAAKERRVLGELKTNLEKLEEGLSELPSAKNKEDLKNKLEESANLITKSKELITKLNENNSGIIKKQVGKLIDALVDDAPFPADHLSSGMIKIEDLPAECRP